MYTLRSKEYSLAFVLTGDIPYTYWVPESFMGWHLDYVSALFEPVIVVFLDSSLATVNCIANYMQP